MKNKIDHPKVFISYAWGSQDYQTKVLSFATKLVGDGIDVVLDKWELTEGNDTYAFMEKCVTDPSITNVLILLDPLYEKKANERAGGVGTETQIISPEIYQKVMQDKFLPVIIERDNKGKVCKPAYLQGALHFDLTDPDTYDDEYQRLVKKLYGVDVYKKPELGNKPEWVDAPVTTPSSTILAYQALKSQPSAYTKESLFENYLDKIKKDCLDFANNNTKLQEPFSNYIQSYDSANSIRDSFLQLVKMAVYVENSCKKIAAFFEDITNAVDSVHTLGQEVIKVRIHEFFIYTIAYYLKNKNYPAVGYILGKTYFYGIQQANRNGARSFQLFYSASDHENLDRAMKERDNKQYYSGTAHHWIESIAVDFCSKEQFVLADLICYNYSVYSNTYLDNWIWFPITYIYDNRDDSVVWRFARKLVSKEYVKEILPVFGFNRLEEFVKRMNEIENRPANQDREVRFSLAYNAAFTLGDFVKSGTIGTVQ